MDSVPVCTHEGCHLQGMLDMGKMWAAWFCPTHGAFHWIENGKLNGVRKLAIKIGGTD